MAAGRRSAAEWRCLVDDWAASGLTKSEFARAVGVHPTTLGWWRWHLRSRERRAGVSTEAALAFAEVEVLADTDSGRGRVVPDFVVELGAVRVRVAPGFHAGELQRLLAALC